MLNGFDIFILLGLFGFLTYEVEGGKKLFFHTSEVTDGIKLHQGDLVEFVLVVNQRSGKSSGCNVTKIRLVYIKQIEKLFHTVIFVPPNNLNIIYFKKRFEFAYYFRLMFSKYLKIIILILQIRLCNGT